MLDFFVGWSLGAYFMAGVPVAIIIGFVLMRIVKGEDFLDFGEGNISKGDLQDIEGGTAHVERNIGGDDVGGDKSNKKKRSFLNANSYMVYCRYCCILAFINIYLYS